MCSGTSSQHPCSLPSVSAHLSLSHSQGHKPVLLTWRIFLHVPFCLIMLLYYYYGTFIAAPSVCHMPCLRICLALIIFWRLSILHNSVWQRQHTNCLMNEWGTHNSQVPRNKTEWTALHHRWPPSFLFTYNCSPILPCHQKQLSYVYWKEIKVRAGVIAHLFKALVRQARRPDFKSPEPHKILKGCGIQPGNNRLEGRASWLCRLAVEVVRSGFHWDALPQ